jgi:hypothetical protein
VFEIALIGEYWFDEIVIEESELIARVFFEINRTLLLTHYLLLYNKSF